jgi:hydrogenase maturation protease
MAAQRQITILGVGNLLFTDEGLGIHVIERLQTEFVFPEHVSLVDGGTLGLSLLGVVTAADDLIIVDAIRNGGDPGTLYRTEGDDVPYRVMAKNSLHQVDLLETMTLCRVLDQFPDMVIIGVEPVDIESMGIELTPIVASRVEPVIEMVLKELDRLGVRRQRKES